MGDSGHRLRDFSTATYEELRGEVQGIVALLGSAEVSIDEVADLVKRAKDILGECRHRIKSTRDEVEAILSDDA